jgi:hypothetical protein
LKGATLVRECPQRYEFVISSVLCTIWSNSTVGFTVMSPVGTVDDVVLEVSVNSAQLGSYETQAASNSPADVTARGTCPGSSVYTTSPCVVDILELEYEPNGALGQVQGNSRARVRVSCPETLEYNGGDYLSNTKQTPSQFELDVTGCVVK